MAVRSATRTRTFVLLDAWASTTPHACAPGCDRPHVHVGDPCAVPRCQRPLLPDQAVYAVTQSGGPDAPPAVPCLVNPALTTATCGHAEQWVCWRHIHPHQEPT